MRVLLLNPAIGSTMGRGRLKQIFYADLVGEINAPWRGFNLANAALWLHQGPTGKGYAADFQGVLSKKATSHITTRHSE